MSPARIRREICAARKDCKNARGKLRHLATRHKRRSERLLVIAEACDRIMEMLDEEVTLMSSPICASTHQQAPTGDINGEEL